MARQDRIRRRDAEFFVATAINLTQRFKGYTLQDMNELNVRAASVFNVVARDMGLVERKNGRFVCVLEAADYDHAIYDELIDKYHGYQQAKYRRFRQSAVQSTQNAKSGRLAAYFPTFLAIWRWLADWTPDRIVAQSANQELSRRARENRQTVDSELALALSELQDQVALATERIGQLEVAATRSGIAREDYHKKIAEWRDMASKAYTLAIELQQRVSTLEREPDPQMTIEGEKE